MDYYTTVQAVIMVASVALYVLILVLDVLPAFLPRIPAAVLSYICIALHLILMPLMLVGGFTLEVMILAYAISVFAYTLARYIAYIRKARADEKGEEA